MCGIVSIFRISRQRPELRQKALSMSQKNTVRSGKAVAALLREVEKEAR